MAVLMLQAGVEDSLRKLGEQVELRDSGGELVGYYVSPAEYRKMQYGYANSLVTDEELDAARKQPGGKTLAEIRQLFPNV